MNLFFQCSHFHCISIVNYRCKNSKPSSILCVHTFMSRIVLLCFYEWNTKSNIYKHSLIIYKHELIEWNIGYRLHIQQVTKIISRVWRKAQGEVNRTQRRTCSCYSNLSLIVTVTKHLVQTSGRDNDLQSVG